MPANECIPYFEDADRVTGHCTATVRGKRFVAVSGNLQTDNNVAVAEAGSGVAAFGVAGYDGATGAKIPVITGNQIVPVLAGAALTAGQEVQSDAQGRAIPLAAGKSLGKVLTAQSTVDADAMIKINL